MSPLSLMFDTNGKGVGCYTTIHDLYMDGKQTLVRNACIPKAVKYVIEMGELQLQPKNYKDMLFNVTMVKSKRDVVCYNIDNWSKK